VPRGSRLLHDVVDPGLRRDDVKWESLERATTNVMPTEVGSHGRSQQIRYALRVPEVTRASPLLPMS
jgi:hypothetical protein